MFEKEAKERAKDYTDNAKRQVAYECGFLDGVDLGYNKATEWHYVKDGDLPKDEDWKCCVSRSGYPYVAKYEELFVSWTNQENKEVMCPYAWKEIVFPKEDEIESEMFPEITLPEGSSEFIDKVIADAEKRVKEKNK